MAKMKKSLSGGNMIESTPKKTRQAHVLVIIDDKY